MAETAGGPGGGARMVGRSGFKGLRPVYTGDFCCDFSAIFCTQLKLSQSLCSAQRADLFLSNLFLSNLLD